jgi:hypothetical protein
MRWYWNAARKGKLNGACRALVGKKLKEIHKLKVLGIGGRIILR